MLIVISTPLSALLNRTLRDQLRRLHRHSTRVIPPPQLMLQSRLRLTGVILRVHVLVGCSDVLCFFFCECVIVLHLGEVALHSLYGLVIIINRRFRIRHRIRQDPLFMTRQHLDTPTDMLGARLDMFMLERHVLRC